VLDIERSKAGTPVEVFENLSMDPADRRYVARVLDSESLLVAARPAGAQPSTDPPADTVIPPAGQPSAGEIPRSAYLTNGSVGKVLNPIDDPAGFISAGKLNDVDGTEGVFLLDRIDLFNLLCVPGLTDAAALANLEKFCRDRRAFLIADCAPTDTVDRLQHGPTGLTGGDGINAAFYFPWVVATDPLRENQRREFPPSGFVAGVYARTDSSRGVWKAPAGTEASLIGALATKTALTDDEHGVLNRKGINCVRTFPDSGPQLWGARTRSGGDERDPEWKYVPVRRTALFIEESLHRGLRWVVFEPNDEPLWAQIRHHVGAFLHDLFRQGAFQGQTPQEAYFVHCGKETTTQDDIDQGVVNIVVGVAPLEPAEFVRIEIQQIAGQARADESVQPLHTVEAQRFDPYKNFKFRLKWDGRYVAGVSKVKGLRRTSEVVTHRDGADPRSSRKLPGRTKYEPITLERGVTHDTDFERWANLVWNLGSGLGGNVSLEDFRKDITLERYDEAGQLVCAYKIFRCWVSEYQGLPDLDANANAVAIQHLKLQNEGWERDPGAECPARLSE